MFELPKEEEEEEEGGGNEEEQEEDTNLSPIAIFNSGATLILCIPISSDEQFVRYVYSKEDRLLADQSNILGIVTLTREREHYTLPDIEEGSLRELQGLRDTCPLSPDLVKIYLKQLQFNEAYKAKNGINWNHYFSELGPRSITSHHMWKPKCIGHVYQVCSSAPYWSLNGATNEYRQDKEDQIKLEIETVSVSPKVFVIRNFLSSCEADNLISLARGRMKDSVLVDGSGGSMKNSKVRTSKNTWISRNENFITDTIYRRAADLLQISDEKVRDFGNAEPMQVVNYQVGGKFDYHYDWFINHKGGQGNNNNENGESRFLTLLLYLSDKIDEDAGGDTGFYHGKITQEHDANNLVRDGVVTAMSSNGIEPGMKLHPGKGGAVLFYNLLEDGNGDVKSQHSGMPVMKGEKWLANLWIWDPTYAA